MKRLKTIAEFVFVAGCTAIAVMGSYRSHRYSIQESAPEVVAERITNVEYVEMPSDTYDVQIPAETPIVRTSSFVNLTFEDMDLLEQIAMAEAGNQDVVGKALVMCVVLNRADKHGMSIRDVIFSPDQFATAGMCRGDDGCHEAIAMILDGWDESQGALYFCSEGWNYYGDEHLFKHGDHWFSR